MQFLSDAIRVTIARRLVDRWLELAVYFGIPPADRAAFPKGNEPLKILEWLEQRNKLSANELQEAFQKLQWDDLITELETPQSSNEDSPIEDFGTQTRMKDVIEDNPYLLGTSFVGREQELNDLTSWLTETDCKYTNSV
jgi:hypothetical protein